MDLQVVPNLGEPLTLYYENSGIIANLKELRIHKKSLHVERKYNLIWDLLQEGKIVLVKIMTQDNLGNPFMKALGTSTFEKHRDGLDLKDMTHLL